MVPGQQSRSLAAALTPQDFPELKHWAGAGVMARSERSRNEASRREWARLGRAR